MNLEDPAIVSNLRPMLTVTEVARILHVHNNTVRRWSDRGMIRAYCISQRGDRRFIRDDVLNFLLELEAHGGNPQKASAT